MTRVAAVQSWPELKKPAALTQVLTASRSASSKTTTGALPPSSRWTRLSVCEAAFATSLPVATSPVSDTMLTPGWRTMPAPTGSPPPGVPLKRRGGKKTPPSSATPHRLAVTGDDVEDAGRKNPRRQFGHPQGAQWRPLGRLEDHAVAGGQRRGDLPDRHHQRVVPGGDGAHNADRLSPDHARVAAHVLAGGATFERAGGAGEEPQVVHARWDLFREKEGARLAHVRRLDVRHRLGVGKNRIRQLEQHLAPLLGNRLEPVHVGFAGGRHAAVDVLLGTLRHLGHDLAGRRVDDLLRLIARAVNPLAADEH